MNRVRQWNARYVIGMAKRVTEIRLSNGLRSKLTKRHSMRMVRCSIWAKREIELAISSK